MSEKGFAAQHRNTVQGNTLRKFYTKKPATLKGTDRHT